MNFPFLSTPIFLICGARNVVCISSPGNQRSIPDPDPLDIMTKRTTVCLMEGSAVKIEGVCLA